MEFASRPLIRVMLYRPDPQSGELSNPWRVSHVVSSVSAVRHIIEEEAHQLRGYLKWTYPSLQT